MEILASSIADSGASSRRSHWFSNVVIVTGYTIPQRSGLGSKAGLFHRIFGLLSLRLPSSQYWARSFVKSFSAILVPVREVDSMGIWQLL